MNKKDTARFRHKARLPPSPETAKIPVNADIPEVPSASVQILYDNTDPPAGPANAPAPDTL